jgi:hypothetical protein
LRIRIALSLGAFLLAGGAVMGTAMATAAPAQVQPPTSASTPAQAPPSLAPTTARPAAPTEPPKATRKPEVAPVPGQAAEKAPGAVRVPRAIPAGPTGDLHLPAITEAN